MLYWTSKFSLYHTKKKCYWRIILYTFGENNKGEITLKIWQFWSNSQVGIRRTCSVHIFCSNNFQPRDKNRTKVFNQHYKTQLHQLDNEHISTEHQWNWLINIWTRKKQLKIIYPPEAGPQRFHLFFQKKGNGAKIFILKIWNIKK